MEALGLTAEQAKIVAGRGSDVLVTAGAGSGKTRVLVERYVSLLGECRMSEIAAVTFTDAAASEMRERVRREVLGRPELAPHRPHLDEATIGTVHSLCSRILREHPVEAGIDPTARTLSEDEAELETITACSDALEAAADADDRRALALREIGVYALTLHLPRMVARRNEVTAAYRALPGAPPAWADAIRARLDVGVAAAVEQARPWLAATAAWLKNAHAEAGEDALSSRVGSFLDALGDPAEGDWRSLLDRLTEAVSRVNLSGGSARNWTHDLDEVKDALRAVRDTVKRLDGFPRWNDHDAVALDALDSLKSLFDDACARYDARKRELAALDYLDLEVKTAHLLRSHPDVAASYRRRYRHLMVDELQDTNPAQIEILGLLSRGADAAAPEPERFFVGDVKQAIYRFRGSDVRHFTRLRHDVEAAGTVLSLSQSFRAHDPLVETLNVIFGRVFGGASEEFEAPMQAMTGRGPGSPPGPHLVVLPVSATTPSGDKASESDRRRVEADAIARGDRIAPGARHARLGPRAQRVPARPASGRRHPPAPPLQRPPVRAGVGEPPRPLPHPGGRRVLHQAGGLGPDQPARLAGRARRPDCASGRTAVSPVHDRRPDAPRAPFVAPSLAPRAQRPARGRLAGKPPLLHPGRGDALRAAGGRPVRSAGRAHRKGPCPDRVSRRPGPRCKAATRPLPTYGSSST